MPNRWFQMLILYRIWFRNKHCRTKGEIFQNKSGWKLDSVGTLDFRPCFGKKPPYVYLLRNSCSPTEATLFYQEKSQRSSQEMSTILYSYWHRIVLTFENNMLCFFNKGTLFSVKESTLIFFHFNTFVFNTATLYSSWDTAALNYS